MEENSLIVWLLQRGTAGAGSDLGTCSGNVLIWRPKMPTIARCSRKAITRGLVKLVFFISDNGGLQGYGDNGFLKGAKTTLFEGGHRVPGIVSWHL